MPEVRLELDEYTIRTLDSFKAMRGLKNRSEAVRELAKENASQFIAPKVNNLLLKELNAEYGDYKTKKNIKPMTDEQLRRMLGFEK